jgi:hypothetical protein
MDKKQTQLDMSGSKKIKPVMAARRLKRARKLFNMAHAKGEFIYFPNGWHEAGKIELELKQQAIKKGYAYISKKGTFKWK